jgi:hypothetical protein
VSLPDVHNQSNEQQPVLQNVMTGEMAGVLAGSHEPSAAAAAAIEMEIERGQRAIEIEIRTRSEEWTAEEWAQWEVQASSYLDDAAPDEADPEPRSDSPG